MARDEHDREDLLAEATALVQRVKFLPAGTDDEVVVGFRADGAASFFLGADPVYQFNSQGALRRAYVDGLMVKARDQRLVSLRRVRTSQQVVLLSAELDAAQANRFLTDMTARLMALRTALEAGTLAVAGSIPAGVDVVARARQWLKAHAESPGIADSPRAR
ncbi:MAG: hypothetical protein AB7O62_25440 [Pirellulales bacterium]